MTNTNENTITHLFLGFNEDEQPTLVPFTADKNIEIIGQSGSGYHNLANSILLQSVNNGNPKKVYIIADRNGDYYPFIEKGAQHTSNLEEYVDYVYNAYEALSEGYQESILLIENLDEVIKATDAEVVQHLLLAIEEQRITVIALGEQKSLLTGLFNITLTQVKNSKAGNFSVSYDNATEENSFKIKAQCVNLFKEEIRDLV